MAENLAPAAAALWAGVLTSVSPCPLTTNLTALSYISKHSASGRLAVLGHGLLYAAGRALAYLAVGFLLVKGLLSAPSFSFFMQKYGAQALSPLLVLAGMFLLGLVGGNLGSLSFFDVSAFRGRAGLAASGLMGFAFALAFCPVSAALYFGLVLPLAAAGSAPVAVPLLFGLGTALPVIGLALALDLGVRKAARLAGAAGGFEKYARPATGWVFTAAGIYLGLKYIFGAI